jgi:hypothetical protein
MAIIAGIVPSTRILWDFDLILHHAKSLRGTDRQRFISSYYMRVLSYLDLDAREVDATAFGATFTYDCDTLHDMGVKMSMFVGKETADIALERAAISLIGSATHVVLMASDKDFVFSTKYLEMHDVRVTVVHDATHHSRQWSILRLYPSTSLFAPIACQGYENPLLEAAPDCIGAEPLNVVVLWRCVKRQAFHSTRRDARIDLLLALFYRIAEKWKVSNVAIAAFGTCSDFDEPVLKFIQDAQVRVVLTPLDSVCDADVEREVYECSQYFPQRNNSETAVITICDEDVSASGGLCGATSAFMTRLFPAAVKMRSDIVGVGSDIAASVWSPVQIQVPPPASTRSCVMLHLDHIRAWCDAYKACCSPSLTMYMIVSNMIRKLCKSIAVEFHAFGSLSAISDTFASPSSVVTFSGGVCLHVHVVSDVKVGDTSRFMEREAREQLRRNPDVALTCITDALDVVSHLSTMTSRVKLYHQFILPDYLMTAALEGFEFAVRDASADLGAFSSRMTGMITTLDDSVGCFVVEPACGEAVLLLDPNDLRFGADVTSLVNQRVSFRTPATIADASHRFVRDAVVLLEGEQIGDVLCSEDGQRIVLGSACRFSFQLPHVFPVGTEMIFSTCRSCEATALAVLMPMWVKSLRDTESSQTSNVLVHQTQCFDNCLNAFSIFIHSNEQQLWIETDEERAVFVC